MATITEFDGTGDVIAWAFKVKAKLIAKGYKTYLLDENKPKDQKELMSWHATADKAIGLILTYMHPNVQVQFEDKVTPQTLIEAVVKRFCPDQQQEIDRLEKELNELKYDGSDPVAWSANVRGLIAKLTIRNVTPTARAVKNAVLKALEQESEYKIRVEIIRQNQPDISLDDLWVAVGRLPYPLQQVENAFAAMRVTSRGGRQKNVQERTKRCFVCGKKTHLSYACPKRVYFDSSSDSDNEQKGSKKDKSKNSSGDEKKKDKSKNSSGDEKKKEKKKDKAMSNTYSFFSQIVLDDELEAEHAGSGINW
jgi:hypothetical protein